MKLYPIGTRVQVVLGSGLSGKNGTIISPKEIPTKQTGGGTIPDLPGYYKPVDWTKEQAIRYDDGTLGIMFRNRLYQLGWTEHGEWHCACGTMIGKNLKDEQPFALVAEHKKSCPKAGLVEGEKRCKSH